MAKSDELHRENRRKVSPAAAEFLDTIYTSLSEPERASLPPSIADYVNALVGHALRHLPTFAEPLAQNVFRTYEDSPGGERFILDPLRTDQLSRWIVFLDGDGELVSVKNPDIEWTLDKPQKLELRRYQLYEFLTGPQTGARFFPKQRPMTGPTYRAGMLARRYAGALRGTGQPQSQRAAASPQSLEVFLCHGSENKPQVRELVKRLSADGFDPWLDEDRLLPGQDWEYEIARAVQATDIIVVCLSNQSISKRGYVQKEIKRALDVADEQPEGAIFIIPAKLEPCSVPDRLAKWQWVDLFRDDGYDRLVRALHAARIRRT